MAGITRSESEGAETWNKAYFTAFTANGADNLRFSLLSPMKRRNFMFISLISALEGVRKL